MMMKFYVGKVEQHIMICVGGCILFLYLTIVRQREFEHVELVCLWILLSLVGFALEDTGRFAGAELDTSKTSLKNRYWIDIDTGFLPKDNLERLPTYFEPWETIIDRLAELNRERRLVKEIDRMPALNPNRLLRDGRELRRAYVVLAMLTQSYVHGSSVPWWRLRDENDHGQRSRGGDKTESDLVTIVPKQLAIPFDWCCRQLDLPRVIVAAATDLWNVTFDKDTTAISTNVAEIGRFRLISSFTGTESEHYFHATPAAMHRVFSTVLLRVLRAPSAIMNDDVGDVEALCLEIADVLRTFRVIFREGAKRIDPSTFYEIYRPLLKGFDDASRPIRLTKSDGRTEAVVAGGPSAGQSSMIIMLDALLGIEHACSAVAFQREMVERYIPAPHRRLLHDFCDALVESGNIRDYLKLKTTTDAAKSASLREAFNGCIGAYADFRHYHLSIASRYLRATQTGTGKSTFRVLLREIIDRTKRARAS